MCSTPDGPTGDHLFVQTLPKFPIQNPILNCGPPAEVSVLITETHGCTGGWGGIFLLLFMNYSRSLTCHYAVICARHEETCSIPSDTGINPE